jgi:hypothetical protein
MTSNGLGTRIDSQASPIQSHKAFVITCSIAEIPTVALIDTGASSNFVSYKLLQEIINNGLEIEVQHSNLILKLANQQTISTAGYVELRISIKDKEIVVPLFIVETLAYPIILGCEFLRKEQII